MDKIKFISIKQLQTVENYGSILRTIEIKEENDRGTIIEYFKIYDNR